MSRNDWAGPSCFTESEALDRVEVLRTVEHDSMKRRYISDDSLDYFYDSKRWQSSSRAGQFRRQWLRYLTEAGVFE